MRADWVREIREQCVEANVPFFFKQWGGFNKKAAGRVLDGRTWNQFPVNNKMHIQMDLRPWREERVSSVNLK